MVKSQDTRIRFYCLCFAIVVGLTGCAKDPRMVERNLIEEGDRLYGQHRFSSAIEAWDRAYAINPENSAVEKRLGLSYLRLGNFRMADELLNRYLKKNPDDPEVVFETIRIRLLIQDLATARSMLSKVSPEHRTDARYGLLRGDLMMLEKNYPDAERQLRSLVDDEKVGLAARIKLAMCMVAQNKDDEADSIIGKIDTVYMGEPIVLLQLGDYFKLVKENAKAEAYYRAAVDKLPNDIGVKIFLVNFYLNSHDYRKAIPLLEASIELDPSYLPAKKLLVQTYLSTGDMKKAESLLNELNVADSVDSELHMLKGRYHLQASEPTFAETYFEYVLSKEPNSPAAHYWVAIALLKSGQIQLAKQHLIKALTHAKNFIDAEIAIAGLHYRLGEYDIAAGYLVRVVKKEPENLRAYKLLGGVRMAQKQYDNAIEAFETAALIHPSDTVVTYYLARAYEYTGDVDKAIALYKQSLSQDFILNACLRYAKLLTERSSPEEAEQIIGQLRITYPNNGYISYTLGEIAMVKGDLEKAIHYFVESLELNPETIPAYLKLADLYSQTDNLSSAIDVLKRCTSNTDYSAVPFQKEADLFFKDDMTDNAIEILKKAVQLYPKNDTLKNNLAYLYLDKEIHYNEALELAKTAYHNDPDSPWFADTMGWAYHKKGMHQQALWYLKQALSKVQKDDCKNRDLYAAIEYHTGSVLYGLKEYDKALVYLNGALEHGLSEKDRIKAQSYILAMRKTTPPAQQEK